jgi:ATP-dependent helicase HrpB
VEDLRRFRWLEAPSDSALDHAEQLLLDLGALEDGGHSTRISDLGKRMLAFPVHPRYSRMLLAAQTYGCVYEACLVAALTQGRDLLIRKVTKDVEAARDDVLQTSTDGGSSDFWILIRAWEYAVDQDFHMDALRRLGIHALTARQVGPLLDQFLRIAKQEGLDVSRHRGESSAVQRCILIGFIDRLSRRMNEGTLRCEIVHGRRGELARESVVRDSPLFVAAEIREIGTRQGEVNTILSLATAIEIEWLQELFPGDVRSELSVVFDAATRKVLASDVLRFRDLILVSRRVEPPPADEAAQLLAREVASGRLDLPKWDHSVAQWILRLNLLAQWCPELHLSPIDDDAKLQIIEQLCHGLSSYKELKDRPVKPAVMAWLGGPERELIDKYVPERITLSNGRTPKVMYDSNTVPYISLRIQELFGVTQTPTIAMGRVQLNVHILAPSMRPVQVTADLASFWREHYPRIKSELQRKYPKHEWR